MKDLYGVVKKMTKKGKKQPFMSQNFSGFFLPKLKKKNQKSKTVFYIEAFDLIEV